MRTVPLRFAAAAAAAALLAALPACGKKKRTVTLRVSPSGALVNVDGREVRQAPEGGLALELEPGPHVLKVSKDGFVEKSVTLAEDSAAELSVTLEPQAGGVLLLRSTPAGAEVYVGGERAGATPLRVADLPPGRVEVRIEKPYHQPYRTVLEIRPGETVEHVASLVSTEREWIDQEIKKDPKNAERLQDLVRQAAADGHYTEALDAVDRLVALGRGAGLGPHGTRAVQEIDKVARALAEELRKAEAPEKRREARELLTQFLKRRLEIRTIQEENRIRSIEKETAALRARIAEMKERREGQVEETIRKLMEGEKVKGKD